MAGMAPAGNLSATNELSEMFDRLLSATARTKFSCRASSFLCVVFYLRSLAAT